MRGLGWVSGCHIVQGLVPCSVQGSWRQNLCAHPHYIHNASKQIDSTPQVLVPKILTLQNPAQASKFERA